MRIHKNLYFLTITSILVFAKSSASSPQWLAAIAQKDGNVAVYLKKEGQFELLFKNRVTGPLEYIEDIAVLPSPLTLYVLVGKPGNPAYGEPWHQSRVKSFWVDLAAKQTYGPLEVYPVQGSAQKLVLNQKDKTLVACGPTSLLTGIRIKSTGRLTQAPGSIPKDSFDLRSTVKPILSEKHRSLFLYSNLTGLDNSAVLISAALLPKPGNWTRPKGELSWGFSNDIPVSDLFLTSDESQAVLLHRSGVLNLIPISRGKLQQSKKRVFRFKNVKPKDQDYPAGTAIGVPNQFIIWDSAGGHLYEIQGKILRKLSGIPLERYAHEGPKAFFSKDKTNFFCAWVAEKIYIDALSLSGKTLKFLGTPFVSEVPAVAAVLIELP